MRTLLMLILLSGCAAEPHRADTGISGAVIASGGAELNPHGPRWSVSVVAESPPSGWGG